MQCPRCETTGLIEKTRDGVQVDVCATCRGVWLDRGELEKIITRATNEFDEDTPTRFDARAPGKRHRADSEDGYYDGDRNRNNPNRPHKRRRWFDMFGEIFD